MSECIKCEQEVVRHETVTWCWVLPHEATSQMVTKCPVDGRLHEVEDDDDD